MLETKCMLAWECELTRGDHRPKKVHTLLHFSLWSLSDAYKEEQELFWESFPNYAICSRTELGGEEWGKGEVETV